MTDDNENGEKPGIPNMAKYRKNKDELNCGVEIILISFDKSSVCTDKV